MAERIVIALGGNALGKTPTEQLSLVRETARPLVDLVEKGYELVIGHGNGPQVGMINLAMEYSAQKGGSTPFMPFAECGAMTQGYIGYHLQQANPVGCFYTRDQAEKMAANKGLTFMEDAGRGYRRVVPSPIPKRIVEIEVVEQLVRSGAVVITVGGGGIPVVERGHGLQGVEAVIDKDRASSLLARELRADRLIILTAVDRVCVNFGKPDQAALSEMSLADCARYIAEGQFAPGSMLPKVEACMDFVASTPGGRALITSLSQASDALEGNTGTVIHK